jgi:uncharacterized membrane protein
MDVHLPHHRTSANQKRRPDKNITDPHVARFLEVALQATILCASEPQRFAPVSGLADGLAGHSAQTLLVSGEFFRFVSPMNPMTSRHAGGHAQFAWFWPLLGVHDASTVAGVRDASFAVVRPLPPWAVILVAVLGLAAAGLNLLPSTVLPRRTRATLVLLRLLGVGVLLLMLAQVELRLTVDRDLPPSIAVLHDTSASMGLRDAAGGKTRLEAASAASDALEKAAGRRLRFARYGFTWRLAPLDAAPAATDEGATRIADALAELLRREDRIEAVVLLTDGNDTGGDRGAQVIPLLRARGIPVYPVVFGRDDTPAMGVVRMASSAPYVRLGDTFVLSAHVSASGVAEQPVRVSLYEEGSSVPLASREQVRVGGAGPVAVSFAVKPSTPGLKTYRIAMEGLEGSASDRRLVAGHRVEVVDEKIRVLYVDIPRDERKILGIWLARDPAVDFASLTRMPKGGWFAQGAMLHKDIQDGLPGAEADLYQYDVIVLGDIPRADFRAGGDVNETKLRWLVEFVARRGGGLVTLGGRSVYGAGGYGGSALASILPFELVAQGDSQVPGVFPIEPTPLGLSHPLMRLEDDAEANRDAWYDLPRLDGCNRVGRARPGASVLAVRTSGEDAMPVVAIQEVGKGRVLGLAIDTTWRWEMQRAAEAPDHYRRFWGNVVRHLAPDPRMQPGRPRIARDRANPAVGETVSLSTRLVDPLFQPIRGAALTVHVASPSGREYDIYPADGRATPGLYEYEVTLDEPGDWTVAATYKDRVHAETIHAGPGDDELESPRAAPEAMRALAGATGGEVVDASAMEAFARRLGASPRRVSQACTIPLWNLPLTLATVFLVVCLDCLLRKRRGMV